jgi:hypothetical protein
MRNFDSLSSIVGFLVLTLHRRISRHFPFFQPSFLLLSPSHSLELYYSTYRGNKLLIKSLLLRLNRFWLGSEVFASLFPTSFLSFSFYSYFYFPFLFCCPSCEYLAMVTTRTGADIVEQLERDLPGGNERAREQTAAHMEELEQIYASMDTFTPYNFHGNVRGFSDAHMSSLLNLATNLQVEMSELRRSRRRSDSDEDPDERSDDDMNTDILTTDRSRIMSPNELSVLTYGDMRHAECHDSRFSAVLDYR